MCRLIVSRVLSCSLQALLQVDLGDVPPVRDIEWSCPTPRGSLYITSRGPCGASGALDPHRSLRGAVRALRHAERRR